MTKLFEKTIEIKIIIKKFKNAKVGDLKESC